MIHPAAQEVCGLLKKGVQFGLGKASLWSCFHRIIHGYSHIFLNSLLILSKLPHVYRLPSKQWMPSDTILQILIGGQQLGSYLPLVQHPIEKFHLRFCERQ